MRTLLVSLTAAATLAGAAPAVADPIVRAPIHLASGAADFFSNDPFSPVYWDGRRHHGGYVYYERPPVVYYERRVYRHRYPRDFYPDYGYYDPGFGYGRPYRGVDPGAAIAAGVIGLAAGAILGQALAAPPPAVRAPRLGRYTQADYAYCARRYRSFDPGSFTFLGYDGRRHLCRVR